MHLRLHAQAAKGMGSLAAAAAMMTSGGSSNTAKGQFVHVRSYSTMLSGGTGGDDVGAGALPGDIELGRCASQGSAAGSMGMDGPAAGGEAGVAGGGGGGGGGTRKNAALAGQVPDAYPAGLPTRLPLSVRGGGVAGGSVTDDGVAPGLMLLPAQRQRAEVLRPSAMERGGGGVGHGYGSAGSGGGKPGGAEAKGGGRFSRLLELLPWKLLAQHPGSCMMLGVAFIWSITSSLDKLGVMWAPSIWVYIACQRLSMAVLSCITMGLLSPAYFGYLRTHFFLLLLLSLIELLAVVFFFEAIKHIFVSYVVAIKRCNILISVLVGGVVLKESVSRRLPYIIGMIGGMCLIVLEPNSSGIHETSHTSHTL